MFLHLLMSSCFVSTFKSITNKRCCDRCVFVRVRVCGWESASAHVHLSNIATLHRSDRHQPSPSVTDMQLKIHSSLSSSFRSPPFSSSLNSGLKRTFWTRPASKAGECVSLDLSSTRMISFGGSLCEAATCGCCCHSACRKLLYGNEKSMTNSWRTFNDIHIQHSKGRIKTFSAGSQGLGGVHARAYTHTHTRALMHAQKEEGTNEK